ncbi:hypothetical protein [Desulfopila sp. IMCC35008]|uniref:hypothetical protein n=1 Tax=Desulfopila sp. IMCC35008 TaxID=2653858 RepID=UPI0013D8DA5F|nr:hypothetical protein [Desulfopila sp. IMCC35008]
MKVLIGITKEQRNIEEIITRYHGQSGSLVEFGPFISKMDALNWLAYLKSRIGDFEEIIPEFQSGSESAWYGYTFEQMNNV